MDDADIDALLLLLSDPAAYAQTYPDCPGEWAGDVNQDAAVDFADWVALRRFLSPPPVWAPSATEIEPQAITPLP